MKIPYNFLRSKIYKLAPSPYISFEDSGSYIKIIDSKNIRPYSIYHSNYYYFNFKVNKRGGESGIIKFNIPVNYVDINDRVEYYLNGKKKFTGYIESIDSSGRVINIIASWGKLVYQYIQGDLILESTLGAFDIVLSLRSKIEEIGINFDINNITLNNDKKITMSFSGRNISDILDEVESNLSSTFCWGVDLDNNFYFKEFSDIPIKKVVWHNNHFSNSEYEEDSDSLVSRYIVKMKDSIINSDGNKEDHYRILPKIVGADTDYPPIPLEKEIGIKTEIFDIDYKLENYDLAYNFAYNFLTSQTKKEKVSLKSINYNNIDLNINECVECILKPTNNYYKVIDFNDFTINNSRINNLYSSDILDIDDAIEFRKYPNYKQQQSVLLTDIDKYYKEVCNYSYNLTKIVIFFSDGKDFFKDSSNKISTIIQVEDKNNSQRKYCKNGFGIFDVRGYDKRDIIITSERSNILYDKFICFFDLGSKVVSMNVRTINYTYENNSLNIDAELSKMNTKLTNYLYEQEEKRKNLEKLLTYKY